MGKYNKLAKNTGVFFIANFGSKVLTFLLVRFYTELLSPTEYGIIDLLNTTASLAFPLVTLCITEAVLRFSIDDIDNRGKILTNGVLVAVIGNLAFVLTAPIFLHIDNFADNVVWLYLLTLTNSLFTVFAHFSRGIGKSKLFAASGLVHTALQIGLNILFLLFFRWGITGYFIAAVLANVLSGVFVFAVGHLFSYIIFKLDRKYLRTMIIYALPLIPNSVFWWIMQSSDRYVITYMLGSEANGLYAVANKIPTIISTISSIFFQAWQISSVEEVNSKDKTIFYSRVFSVLSALLTCATSFLLVILQPLYRVLTEESYYIGWVATPFLLFAMVFSCYSSFLGTNYVAMKKTTGVFLTTVGGAVINIVLNIFLTRPFGIIGTAVATAVGFFITWGARVFGTRRFVRIRYPLRTFIVPTVLLLAQTVLLSVGVNSIWIQCIFFAVIIILYIDIIVMCCKKGIFFAKSFLNRKKA